MSNLNSCLSSVDKLICPVEVNKKLLYTFTLYKLNIDNLNSYVGHFGLIYALSTSSLESLEQNYHKNEF